MHDALVVVIGIVVGVYLVIAFVFVWIILSLARTKLWLLTQAEVEEHLNWLPPLENDDEWLVTRGFESLGIYEVKSGMYVSYLAAWRHRTSACFVIYYFLQTPPAIEIVSLLDRRGAALSTSTVTSKSGAPQKPHYFSQAFRRKPIGELLPLHLEAEELIKHSLRSSSAPTRPSFEEYFVAAIRDEAAYVRTHRLWPLRAPFWFVASQFRHNRSIAEQIARGDIRLNDDVTLT